MKNIIKGIMIIIIMITLVMLVAFVGNVIVNFLMNKMCVTILGVLFIGLLSFILFKM